MRRARENLFDGSQQAAIAEWYLGKKRGLTNINEVARAGDANSTSRH
jgi:hypothetical protein